MTEREKVIKGLGEALEVLGNHVPERYLGYSAGACLDAIELLKAQFPRLMTLEEAQATDYVWYECKITGCVFPASVCMSADTWHGDYTTVVQQIGYGGYKFVLDKEYGKTWRCWTPARPTDAQREAVKWG